MRRGAERAANFFSVAAPDPADLDMAVELELKGGSAGRSSGDQFDTELSRFLDGVEQALGSARSGPRAAAVGGRGWPCLDRIRAYGGIDTRVGREDVGPLT